MDKKELAQKALVALMCAAALPAAVQATSNTNVEQTFSAGGACAHNSRGTGCGAASNQNNDRHGCGSSTRHGCGAASRQGCGATPRHGCGAAPDAMTPPPAATNAANAAINNHMTNEKMHQNAPNSSSYSGTSTGPGPNDGYPGTPAGSYNTNYESTINGNGANNAPNRR